MSVYLAIAAVVTILKQISVVELPSLEGVAPKY